MCVCLCVFVCAHTCTYYVCTAACVSTESMIKKHHNIIIIIPVYRHVAMIKNSHVGELRTPTNYLILQVSELFKGAELLFDALKLSQNIINQF